MSLRTISGEKPYNLFTISEQFEGFKSIISSPVLGIYTLAGEPFPCQRGISKNIIIKETEWNIHEDIFLYFNNSILGGCRFEWIDEKCSFGEELLEHMRNSKNITAISVISITTSHSEEPHLAFGDISGTLVLPSCPTDLVCFNDMFKPEGSTKTLSEMNNSELLQYSHRQKSCRIMKKILEHLKK